MGTKFQIVFWRDIPAQVSMKAGRQRLSRPLSERFPVAIDEAAMQTGKTGSDDYLEEWHKSAWQERNGDPETVIAELVAELEDIYSPARLRKLIRQGGVEQVTE